MVITIDLTDEEEKALLYVAYDVQEWAENAVRNRIRQAADQICTEAIEDETDTILTAQQKQQLRTALDNAGINLVTVSKIPVNIKRAIVAAANITLLKDKE